MGREQLMELEALCLIPSAPGFEHLVREYIKERIKGKVDTVYEDPQGNLIAQMGEGEKKVLVAAHMDEIGFITRFVDTDGAVYVDNLGGWELVRFLGAKLDFFTNKVFCKGIMRRRHDAKKETLSVEDIFVDIGARSKEEALESGVEVGVPICLERSFYRRGRLLFSPSFDDKIGCYILLSLIHKFCKEKLKYSLFCIFSVQEEIGLHGAHTYTERVKPQFAIILDTAISMDTPSRPPRGGRLQIGGGPALRVADQIPGRRQLVTDPKVVEFIKKVAEKKDISLQPIVARGSTTEATLTKVLAGGVKVCSISVPTRESHSPFAIVDERDIEQVTALVEGLLREELPI
jgi:endoglucanase